MYRSGGKSAAVSWGVYAAVSGGKYGAISWGVYAAVSGVNMPQYLGVYRGYIGGENAPSLRVCA